MTIDPSVTDPKFTSYVEEVEKNLLEHILKALETQKIPPQEARQTARDFLKELPAEDKGDLLDILQQLSSMHPAARDTYLKFANEEYTAEREQKLKLVAQHLSQGSVDSALAVVKGGSHV